MPLYISSFNMNKNDSVWIKTWIITILLVIGLLGGYEYFLKQRGFNASIESNNDLWSWYRSSITSKQNELVIVGASRSQLGINIPYLKQKLRNYHITQLSINGHYPMATLKSLAEDQNFRGIIVASINAQAMEDRYLDMQEEQNLYYEKESTLYKSFDAFLTATLKANIRFLHPTLRLEDIINYYDKNHAFPKAFYISTHLDQSSSGNYDLVNKKNLYNHFVKQKEKNYSDEPPTEFDKWKSNVDLLINYSKIIENRGGKVILVRFPTFKEHWNLDEKFYPREKYWKLIEDSPNLHAVHFNDVTGLGIFNSPDSSHIDQKDTVEFTEVLFNYLIMSNYLNLRN